MKRRIALVALALGLSSAPVAFAEPVKMSEAQLDAVTGGQGLIGVTVSDVADVQANPTVTTNPNVNVQVSVLSLGGL